MSAIYGYFNDADQVTPAYDPGVSVDCPVCGKVLGHHSNDNRLVTISVAVDDDNRSYFYRAHRSCYDALPPEKQSELDWPIVDAVTKTQSSN